MKKNKIYKRFWKKTSTQLGINRVKNKIKAPTKQDLERREHSSNIRGQSKPYVVYHMWEVWVRVWRTYAVDMGYKCTTKEAIPSKAYWWLPKIKITSQWRVASFIDSNARGWTVMMNSKGSYQKLLVRSLRNIWRPPPPIYDHQNIIGHNITIENFSIVGREDQNLIRAIKEAIYIRVNNPSLNRNIGKYHLPHMWDEVLNNIPELKLK